MVQQERKPNENAITLKELGVLYLSKWRWFVISVVFCCGLACAYLLMTPTVYTRNAFILIKEDNKGKSLSSDIATSFSDLGFVQTNTNIQNEILNFKSPNLMYEVVRSLHLNVSYVTDGAFHKKTLYGDNLPFSVEFNGIANTDNIAFTATFSGDGTHLTISDFVLNDEELDAKPLDVQLGETRKTPVGVLIFKQPAYPQEAPFAGKVYVSRANPYFVADNYCDRLKVSLEDDKATVIRLSFSDQNIQRAEEVLNTVIKVYKENWIRDKNQLTYATNEFIAERLNLIQQELGDVDAKITKFKSTNMIPDLTTTASISIQQASEQDTKIMDLDNQLSIALAMRSYISGTKNQLFPANAGLTDQSIMQLINSYNELQLRRNRLVENSSEENLLVQDLDSQLESLSITILTTLDNYIAALNTKLRTSKSAKEQATSLIASNPVKAGKLLSDERQQKVKESIFLFLLQKREENELSQAFTSYNTRIIATPDHGNSNLPTSPNCKRILIMAILIGFALPMIFFFIQESMKTTVRSRKDFKNVTLPFFGEIPQAYRKKQNILVRLLRRGKQEEEKPEIIVRAKSRNIINEAFRIVRTNLEFMRGKYESGEAHVIMTISANPGSGKTFITANLSSAMAIKGHRTIAIDLDVRRGVLSRYVNTPNTGISDYLSRQVKNYRDIILTKEKSGLSIDIIPCGTIPPNPAELISSPLLAQLIAELRTQYDYIFLDCPPVGIVTDADIIAPLADTTLFIVRAHLFERSMLSEVESFYASHRYSNMGIILNGTESGGLYGYKYGYHSGYGYGYGSKSDYYGNSKS